MEESQATQLLSSAERDRFERDGYFVLDDAGVPEAVLDGIIADLESPSPELPEGNVRVYSGHEWQQFGNHSWHRIMDAWTVSENVKALARSGKIMGALEELYGRKPLPFQTLNFKVGTQQAAHSDALHFNSEPPGFMCGVWVALEDIDTENGPLIYYPGSHKLPEVTMRDVGVAAEKDEYAHYERHIAKIIDREGLEPEYGTISKGQALVWAANLLHGGSPQSDKSRTRLSQVTHYFFEGCKYYTPLLSDESHVHWRNPVWIS